jgi:WD40 repeat protein
MSRRLRIFISSPGDVPKERLRAELIIDRLNQDYGRDLTLETYRWEHEPMIASGHFQDAIELPSAHDIVVFIVWSRLGTPLPERTAVREYRGIDGHAPVTGTEWEYEDALKAARERGEPTILAFRNLNPAPVDAVDRQARDGALAQLEALDVFWRRHFADRDAFVAAFDGYRTLEEFAAHLEQALRKLIERRIRRASDALGPDSLATWTGPPFRGLRAYEFEQAAIYFGRDGVVARAADQLTARAREGTAFLLISGPSGSGKSSLALAALAPRLMKPQRIEGIGILRRAVLRPGDAGSDLATGLAEALTGARAIPELLGPGQKLDDLAALLRSSSDGASYLLEQALSRVGEDARRAGILLAHEKAQAILIVDQLEEIFTREDLSSEERSRFAARLGALSRTGVWVVATLRNDFWHRVAEIEELAALASGDGRLDIAPPSSAELSEIARKPVLSSGLAYEVHETTGLSLDSVIVDHAAAQSGALPLLSFALDELYKIDVLGARGRILTYRAYESLGGLEGAIANRAETVVAALSPTAQAALPRVLRALTTSGAGADAEPVSRPVPLGSFAPGTEVRAVVDALIGARLLVASDAGQEPTVRLAHEALLARWERAREQLAADRRDIETRSSIERQFERWRRAPPAARAGLLLRDPDLAAAIDLMSRWRDELPEEPRAFVARSRRAAAASARRRWLTAAAAMALLMALALASIGALGIAQGQRDDALIAQSRALARDSRAATASGDTTLGVNLALAALPSSLGRPDRPFVREAAAAIADGMVNNREIADFRGHRRSINSVAFSRDGARIVTASDDGDARIWSLADPTRSLTLAHGSRVFTAAFSPDGARVVTASEDHTARVWEARDGSAVLSLRHQGTVDSAVFSPDGSRVVTASWDGSARVWDSRTGAELGRLGCGGGKVLSAVFSPDGASILTVPEDGDVQLWDGTRFAVDQTLTQSHESVEAATFSPDGQLVAAAADDGVTRLWSTSTGALARALERHAARVLAVAFSPDGKHLATGSADGSARVWNVESGALEHELLGSREPVYAIQFSPDGRVVATASQDHDARLWDASSGRRIAVLGGHAGAVLALAFSPSARQLVTASGDSTARFWSIDPGAMLGSIPGGSGPVDAAIFSPDGREVATAAPDGVSALWKASDGGFLAALGPAGAGVVGVAFSGDGKWIATDERDGVPKIRDASTGKVIVALRSSAETAPPEPRPLAFSWTAARIVTVPVAGDPRLWDAASGADLGPLAGHAGPVAMAAFTRDGRRIVTAGADKTARIWDVASRRTILVLAGHEAGLTSAAVSPDGTRVLTTSFDRTARLWDAATGRSLAILANGNSVISGVFSPDGRRALTVSLDHSIRIFDAADGLRLVNIASPDNRAFTSAAFSPDGRLVVTGSDDGAARIWDAAAGEPIATFPGHAGALTGVSFSPDGSSLLAGSLDGTATLWRAPPRCQALIDEARMRIAHRLTNAERARFFVSEPRSGALERIYDAMRPLVALVSPASGDLCR